MPEMKVYQRDHFKEKINDLLDPEIEKEEMLLSSTIADITEGVEKNLAEKIGADQVINDLELKQEELKKAQNRAMTFFRKMSRKRVSYKKALSYHFGKGEKIITPEQCREQIRAWAEALSEKEAEKLPIGRRISYLKAVKTSAKDAVMEAHVGLDLKDTLDELVRPLSLSWVRPLPELAPPSMDRPED